MSDQIKSEQQPGGEYEELRKEVARLRKVEIEHQAVIEQLQKNAEALMRIVHDSHEVLLIARLCDGFILDCNEGFLSATGYAREDVIGKPVDDLGNWINPSDWERSFRALQETGQCTHLEAQFHARGEKMISAGISARVIELGGERCVVCTTRDIAGFKQAKEALHESEGKFRTLFEECGDAICLTTEDGRFTDVNQSAAELFGFSREELLTHVSVNDLYLQPRDRVRMLRELRRKGSVRNFEVVLRKRDGRLIPCLLTVTPRCSKDTSTPEYQAIVRDISGQKQAEQALREAAQRYRAIVEDQTDLICRSLPNGTITYVNEAYCRYFGKQNHELIGRSFMPLIPEEDRERTREHFDSLGPLNPVGTIEHRVIAANGEIRWQQWTNRLILDADNRPIEYQAVGRDITERKQMEDALTERAEEIKLFAYSVSHDLKSPSIGVYGLTQLLRKHLQAILDDKGRNYCDQIVKAAEQIALLAERINVFIATREAPVKIERVNLGEILQMVKDEFSAQINVRRIKWLEPQGTPEICADRISLLRVLRNLVDNALKYGGDPLSEIRIGYQDSDCFHILSVSDNGIGLKMKDPRRIFDFFQRQETSRDIEGAGLGLAIVKEIAGHHRGKAWVEPNPAGGTSFFISISKHL